MFGNASIGCTQPRATCKGLLPLQPTLKTLKQINIVKAANKIKVWQCYPRLGPLANGSSRIKGSNIFNI